MSDRFLRRVLVVMVMSFCGSMITHASYSGTGDTPHYMMIAHSIVFDADLDLANDYADPTNVVYDGRLDAGRHVRAGREGRLRSIHDVGLPLLAAPYFAAAYALAEQVERLPAPWRKRMKLNRWVALKQILGAGMIALTALLAVQVFELGRRACGDARSAFAAAALLALSPPLLTHSYLFFTEVPAALLAVYCFRALTRERLGSPPALAWVGFACGSLVLIHARAAALLPGLAWLAARRGRRAALPFGLGLGLALVLRTGLNLYLWGAWLTSPKVSFGSVGVAGVFTETAVAVLGWLVDQERGLLVQAPVYLLVVPGLWLLRRRAPGAFREIAVPVGVYVLLVSNPILNRYGWHGGWSPVARYLVPVLPLLGGALAVLFEATRRRSAALMLVLSAQVAVDLLLWQHPKLGFDDGDGVSALLSFVDAATGVGLVAAFPSWSVPGWPPALLSAPWLLMAAVVTWAALRAARRDDAATSDQAGGNTRGGGGRGIRTPKGA